MTTNKFNIHRFKLEDYKNDLFKEQIKANNPFFKFIELMEKVESYMPCDILSKYYKTHSDKKSIKLVTDKSFIDFINSTSSTSILKNRFSQTNIKKSYFVDDHLNFIETDLYKAVKNENTQAFTGLTYKNFENHAKMLRNTFIISLFYNRDVSNIYDMCRQARNYTCRDFHLFTEFVKENDDTLRNMGRFNSESELIKPLVEWINYLHKDIEFNIVDVLNTIGVNNEYHNRMKLSMREANMYISYFSGFSQINSSYVRYDYFLDTVYKFLSPNFDVYVRYVNVFANNTDLSINNTINKILQHDTYSKDLLNKLSYTKTTKKTNQISGFVSEHNVRVAFNSEDQDTVDVLTKHVNDNSMFQQELSDKVLIEIKKFKEDNDFHFEIISGDDIMYYYNVNNYDRSGNPQSIYKYGKQFSKSIQNLQGFEKHRSKDGELYNSCMRNPGQQENIRWYAKNDQAKLLILTNEDKTIIRGRAVLWCDGDSILVDRIFATGNEAYLEFTEYLNKSKFIPVYRYNGISSSKEKEYTYWKSTGYKTFKLKPDNIKIFNSANPYLDTLRNFSFVYNEKTNTFEACNHDSSKSDGIRYDPSSNMLIKNHGNGSKTCAICGNSSAYTKIVDIVRNGRIVHCCERHIISDKRILKGKTLLISDSGAIQNTQNGEFGIVRIPCITSLSISSQGYILGNGRYVYVDNNSIDSFTNRKSLLFTSQNPFLNQSVCTESIKGMPTVVYSNSNVYEKLASVTRNVFVRSALYKFLKENPHLAERYKEVIAKNILSVIYENSSSLHYNDKKEIIRLKTSKLYHYYNNIDKMIRANSNNEILELSKNPNTDYSITVYSTDVRNLSGNSRYVFYPKFNSNNGSIDIKFGKDSNSTKNNIKNETVITYAKFYKFGDQTIYSTMELDYFDISVLDNLVKCRNITTRKASTLKEDYELYKWINENVKPVDYKFTLSGDIPTDKVEKKEEGKKVEEKVESESYDWNIMSSGIDPNPTFAEAMIRNYIDQPTYRRTRHSANTMSNLAAALS